jgi:3-oxoadipate enol-lactonase
MPLIYLDDIRLNAEVAGPPDGPALVLIHALGTNLTLWDDLIPLLPPGLRILRFDLRGHGASDVPVPPYAMGTLIRDVERVMQHVGVRDAVVLGLSIGGLIAQGLAVKRLDLVRAMMLSNTAARIGNPAVWDARIAAMRAGGPEGLADDILLRWFGRGFRHIAGIERIRAMLLATPREGWIGCAHAIAGTDFYTPTASLTLPTLVIAGSHDGSTPPDLVRETADLIRGSAFTLIRGAGHLPFVERPGDYAATVTDFLRRIGHV